ncbi:heme-degrading domain-containing protein [Streptomyces sp. H10-C2]|uniref:heme-degrading domain-containing protein n=1 Tax=unclassified Streptomyces TaxID=2593676 RepID=UPI0024BB8A5A|nr:MULTISPECIES: heme-degrading domain-containing protein [unclassified Streptomyces]MDJ0339959.1 heme-degrading domain-containing protein [Streptomyces sp. PH10-H1]MDJ0369404.1 heme-degrading domain-containing protein [Streptomyces sp. H10-C2]
MTTPATPATPADLVAELEAQEQALVLSGFTNDDAWQLGSLLVELARERRAPVTIDIRCGSQQLFHYALDGTSPDNDAWLARKSRVAERYGASSYLVGARFRAKGTTFEESSRLDPDLYAAHGGAVPIRVAGVGVVGTVAVSGLPQSEDHALVIEALTRMRA